MERRTPQQHDPYHYIPSNWTSHMSRVYTNSSMSNSNDNELVGSSSSTAGADVDGPASAVSGSLLGDIDRGGEDVVAPKEPGEKKRKLELEDSDDEFAANVATAISNTSKKPSKKPEVIHSQMDGVEELSMMQFSSKPKKSKKKKKKKHKRRDDSINVDSTNVDAPLPSPLLPPTIPATTASTTADLLGGSSATIAYPSTAMATIPLSSPYYGVDPYMMMTYPSRAGSRGLSLYRTAGMPTTESALLAPYLSHHAAMLPTQRLLQHQEYRHQQTLDLSHHHQQPPAYHRQTAHHRLHEPSQFDDPSEQVRDKGDEDRHRDIGIQDVGGEGRGVDNNNEDGIFDDADDDYTFGIPRRHPEYTMMSQQPQSPILPKAPICSLQEIGRIRRPERDDALTPETTPRSKTIDTAMKVTKDDDDNSWSKDSGAVAVAAKQELVSSITTKDKDKHSPGKRKKPSKPSRRILFSKKEQDAADALLEGKIDLMQVLPEEECRFLGEQLWIFTLQQLEFALNQDSADGKQRKQQDESSSGDQTGDHSATATSGPVSSINTPDETGRDLRNELLEKLAASELLNLVKGTVVLPDKHESRREGASGSTKSTPLEDMGSASNGENQPSPKTGVIPDSSLSCVVKSETSATASSETRGSDNGTSPQTTKAPADVASSNRQEDMGNNESADIATVLSHSTVKGDATETVYPKSSKTMETEAECKDDPAARSHLAAKADAADTLAKTADRMESYKMEESSSDAPSMMRKEPKQRMQSSSGLLKCPELLEAAEVKLSSWVEAIRRWRTENANNDDIDQAKQFPLDGPLSCLFPICAQRFVTSVQLKYARDFLVLKKTETGVIVDMLRLWRQKCNLSNASNLPLAKHLYSIHMRIETGLGSVPHADPDTIEWMRSHLIVLTGAAKDFVVSGQGILSATDFIEKRTKELSSGLIEWRIGKGLPPLKGSGSVAMISGWKAIVKEAIDVEDRNGQVLSGIDFEKEVQNEIIHSREEKKPKLSKSQDEKKRKTSKHPEHYRGPAVDKALNSPDFLSSVFKEKRLKIFSSVGIRTAQELLDADKNPTSPLVEAVVRTRKGTDENSVRPESCVRLVYEWCQRVNKKLGEIEEKTRSKAKPSTKSQIDEARKSSPVKSSGKNKEPFETLSASTRSFLSSIGIVSAEDFLSARTTDIANEFILWRQQRDMAELKGLGAIASVSGWKAIVRKAANSAGMDGIAKLAPKSNSNETKQARKSVSSKKSANKEATDSDVLFGMSRRRFAVRGGGLAYLFELSVRKTKRSKPSLYLTYLGCGKSTRKAAEVRECASLLTKRPAMVPILEDFSEKNLSTDDSAPFSTSISGCGTVELGKYGVRPFPQKDQYDALKKEIKQFVASASTTPADTNGTVSSGEFQLPSKLVPHNVVEKVGKFGGINYFLCLDDPIEKGQTVELTFQQLEPPGYFENKDCDTRHWLQQQISHLPSSYRKDLLEHVSMSIGSSVDRKMNRIVKKSSSSNSDGEASALSVSYVRDVLIARRRIHWVALRIGEKIDEDAEKDIVGMNDDVSPLWIPEVVSKIRSLSDWNEELVRNTMKSEIELEIEAELSSWRFGDFFSTRSLWCPMAERIYVDVLELFSRFLCELDTFCSEKMLVDDICSLVTQAVSNVEALVEGTNLDSSQFSEVLLPCRPGVPHSCQLFPSMDEVAKNTNPKTIIQGENNDGHKVEPEEKVELLVVATTRSDNRGDSRGEGLNYSANFQSVEEMKSQKAVLDKKWYIERQILAVAQALSVCCLEQLAKKSEYRQLSDVSSKLLGAARLAGRDRSLQSVVLSTRNSPTFKSVPLARSARIKQSTNYQPSSSQLFLALIWPILSSSAWKLEVGSSPSSVAFIPPGRKKRVSNYSHHLKQKAAKTRSKLALQTNDLGLSYIPKRTKRLFVNSSSARENIKASHPTEVVVKDALDRYLQSIQADVSDDDKGARERARKVVEHLCLSFDELAPMLHYEEEGDERLNVEGKRPCEVYNCAYLMRLLLVMPSMLRQSDLPMRQVENILGVVRELTDFLSTNHDELFDESLHVPLEHYDGESSVPAFLAPRILNSTGKATDCESITDAEGPADVILASDKSGVTDFIGFVLSQVVICRVTSDDVGRKNRQIPLGFPGLVCRHCMGEGGEGKYFFSSIDSLTTAGTVIEKHIAKCPKSDPKVKAELVQCKSRHGEQRKNLPQGGQAAFFSRLWDRLMSAKISAGASGEVYIRVTSLSSPNTSSSSETTEESDQYDSDASASNSGPPSRFKSHILLMDYLQTTSPWNEKPNLTHAVEQYYDCLEYGGRIYKTKQMPLHFNSEWVLSKVAPNREKAAKT